MSQPITPNCPSCGFILDDSSKYNYCPNCGGKAHGKCFVYITKCKCNTEDYEKMCKKCKSPAVPVTEEEFWEFKNAIDKEYQQVSALEWGLRHVTKSLSRIVINKNGGNCRCTATMICEECGKAYD